jgi:hypothetical protein
MEAGDVPLLQHLLSTLAALGSILSTTKQKDNQPTENQWQAMGDGSSTVTAGTTVLH